MTNETLKAIMAQVLYYEREKVAPADAAFDREVAEFFDRLDRRAVGSGEAS